MKKVLAWYTKYFNTPVQVFWDNARSRIFRESGQFEHKSAVRAYLWAKAWTFFHPWGAVFIQKPGVTVTAPPAGWRAP